jgi:hypothetical protein
MFIFWCVLAIITALWLAICEQAAGTPTRCSMLAHELLLELLYCSAVAAKLHKVYGRSTKHCSSINNKHGG